MLHTFAQLCEMCAGCSPTAGAATAGTDIPPREICLNIFISTYISPHIYMPIHTHGFGGGFL